jgi:uncharacterized protein (TIRG00374 family)
VLLLVGVLPQLADFSEVWGAVRSLTGLEVLLLTAAAVWNIATYMFVMMSALPGLSFRHAFMAGQISTAVSNTVPAGSVFGVGVTYAVLSSFGHRATSIAAASAVSGLWNTFAKLSFPIIALAALAIWDDPAPALVSAAVTGILLLILVLTIGGFALSSERLARRIGDGVARFFSVLLRPLRRPALSGWGDGLAKFQGESTDLLRRRWHWLSFTTIVSHLSLFFVLLVALRTLGVDSADVTWVEAFGAFSFVRLATALPITPGGLGVVELGMSAALVLAGGPEPLVVAAVLVYRVITYGMQIPLGILSYAAWQTEERRRVRTGG